MPAFKITLLGLFISLALGSKCPQDAITKLVVCYYKGETSLTDFNICNCTHLVFTNGVKRAENNSISATEDTITLLEIVKEKKANLSALFTFETKQEETSAILKSENRTEEVINGIVEFLQESDFDGVELNLKFTFDDGVTKESYASFVKSLSKTLSSQHRRVKREGYDVFEKVTDDVTTASYTTQTPKNSTSKTESIKEKDPEEKERKIREETEDAVDKEAAEEEKNVDYATLEEAINAEFAEEKEQNQITLEDVEEDAFEEKKFLFFVRLSIQPEIVAKKYDLKALSRYADILTVPTHNIVNSNEEHLTYHPSRLMGLSDILNTDSILDFLTGMGALKSKMVITMPASVLKFQLKDENKNTPRSPAGSKPQVIDQSQLCSLFNKNNWTIERDDDLTAPYAFSGKTWLAFEDEISVNIKGKYILLRELAGGAIYPIDADVNDGLCTNRTGSGGYLSGALHKNFESLERKPRALVLQNLQEEIHDTAYTNIEAGVKLSEYRIVRVVDHSGAVHVIRKNTKTQFECSRQGYFSHPLGCNKFYRCVKFDQYSDEFTVFEYDCPAGLAFDERWEVCVWPGSLPHGAPCTGSSEIAPVPRSHYQCPSHEGYYADPENCRWFFACLDHARDGITPLTAYEFRCPFGLVFSEEKLACDWPWLVGTCGNKGAAGYLQVNAGGQSQGFHSATFINGGNLEASLGQYGNTDEEASFIGFGKKFGSGLKAANAYNAQNAYQGAQSAGFGYIANQFEDHSDRASFAAFPEYQISGGRSLNKGGVVLDQHVAGISGVGAGAGIGASGGIASGVSGGAFSGASKGFGSGSSFLQQGQFGSGNIQFQPALQTNTLDINSGGQASFQNPVSTPKPFVVGIPSVQINAEKISEYSGHSTIGQTTPQTVIFKQTPSTENIQLTGKAISSTQGYTVSQPAFSAGISAVTPTTATHTFGGISSGAGTSHFSTPSVSFGSTPKPEIHRFGQSQFTNRNQAGVTVPVVAGTGTQSFKYSSAVSTSQAVPVVPVTVPVVTPKPVVGSFGYTASGVGLGVSQSGPTENPFGGFSQSQRISGGKSLENSGVGIPAFVQTHVSEGQNFVSGNAGVSYGASVVSATPSVYTSNGKIGSESHLSAVYSGPTPTPFVHTTIDEKVTNELRFNNPSSSYSVSSVTPKTEFHTFSKSSDSSGLNINAVSSSIPLATGKPDYQIFSQTQKPAVTYGVPVTPQADFNSFKFNGGQSSSVSVTPVSPFDSSSITGSSFGQTTGVLKGFSETTYNLPHSNLFQQLNSFQQKGISQAEKTSFSVPIVATGGVSQTFVTPKPDVKFTQSGAPGFGQQYSYSSSFKQSGSQFGTIQPFGGVSSTVAPPVIQKTDLLVPKSNVVIEQQPVVPVGTVSTSADNTFSTPSTHTNVFPQSSVVGNINFKSSYVPPQPVTVTTPAPFVSITPSTPSIHTNVFPQSPAVSNINFKSTYVRPQPVAVTTPVPAVSISASTPSTHTNVFPQSPVVSSVNFKSSYIPPQPVTVTTPAPVVSITPSTLGPIVVKQPSLNVFGQSTFQGEKIGLETSGPALQQTVVSAPGSVIFSQKSSQQDIKSFTPAVTTAGPTSYNQGISSGFGSKTGFYSQTAAYSPPVTPKVFGSSIQQSSGHFGTTDRSQILLQKEQPINFGFKTNAFEGKRTEFIQQQLPVQVTTTTYQQPAVTTTSKPYTSQEGLLDFEITKSIEINQAHTPKSASPFLIEQQPVNLISEKSFKFKPAVQPFITQQEKEIINTEINSIPGEQYVFQQQVKTPIVPQQKQYIPPVVTPKPVYTYSTAKTIVHQPAVAPTLPVYEAPRIPVTTQSSIISNINEHSSSAGFVKAPSFVGHFENGQPQDVVSSKVKLLPTVTELPQYTPEELSLQTHQSFDSQKITKFGSTPVQNVFIQPQTPSTLKPSINVFENSGHFFQYNGLQNFTSGVKYGINPDIVIPDPPKEYILAQNAYTTVAPEIVSSGKFHSTESTRNGITESTYLPPQVGSRRKHGKTTVVSVGSLNQEEVREDNIQDIFDKYSGRFGEVINGRNDKGRGQYEGERQGSSTVQYEVSSTTPRPKSRGRQYHGAITSGLKATNKYEEYDIDGQRSLDNSKTTIDLKNLKVDKDKKTVIVVSQVSDANPVLIGKLAGQCSCQSNMLELKTKGKTRGSLRRKNKNSQNHQATIINEYLPPFETDPADALTQGEASTIAPETVVIDGSKSNRISYTTENNYVSSSTTVHPEIASSTILSSLGPNGVLSITPKEITEDKLNRKKQFRGRTRYLAPLISEDGLSPISASEIALDYRGDESRAQNEIEGGKYGGNPKTLAGAAFDRYGPGGWRSFDETLQGSIDCQRPGLFRHPKYCNKFYACNYDPWEERYTLHVFNCPIQLTYDSSISACNWPVRGPACADDNLLV